MARASILLSRSAALEASVSASARRPYCVARSAREVLMLVGTVPVAIVLDAAHADTAQTLCELAAVERDDRTTVIVVTDDVTRDTPPGADVLVTPDGLQCVLEGLPHHELEPQLERMMQLTVIDGQLDQALERAADELASCLGVDRCVIAVRGDSTGGAASGAHTWDSLAWNRTSERCRAASLANATLIAPASPESPALESYLAVPLANPVGTYGFVGVVVGRPILFMHRHRTALTAIATRISTELAWRAVHQRTTEELDRVGHSPGHDLLLNTWNRMAMADLAAVYVSGSKRSALPLAAALLDVMDLQGINKRYGLEVGDRLLRRIVDAIRLTIRAEDIVGRWGGDEIAVLLHGTTMEGAERVAERLRAAFDARPLELPGGDLLALPVTLGIATLGPNDDAMTLMARATHASRQARAEGQTIARAMTGPAPRISMQHIDVGEELRATVGGVYRLQHEISRGGMGVVYRAEDLALERPVAIKMLRPDLAEDRAFVEHLRIEAAMLARLQHPNLVQIYSFGQSGGDSYFVMELVEGEGLQQAIERGNLEDTQVPVSEVVQVIEEIASALDALHDRGIVHRDVKPANVIRDPFRNRAVLVDVGIARRFGQFAEAAGTPGYVAPEVVAGQEATALSDVYGLAATTYALLTLVPPWGNDGDVIGRQMSGAPVIAPSAHRPELSCVDDLLGAALSSDSTLRPSSAGAFAASLRSALSIEGLARRPEEPRGRGNMAVPRRTVAKTRGVAFRSVARALGVRDTQRVRDELASTHPELANALVDTAPLAWLPAELFSSLLAVAPMHADRDPARLARDIARATVRASFRRFFPASSATLVPERTLSAIRNVWAQYQTWGTVSSMPVSSTENVVRIADPITDGEMCAWVQGLLEQIVVLAGGKAPTVDHEACVTRGDAACLYRVVWNR
jgi:diguanylate cyclase (GGDEF)-like protein